MRYASAAQHGLQLSVLSNQQMEKVYEATLSCLERTGTNVLNAEARELLAAAGARVDGVRVWIPPRIIEQTLAMTPQSFSLWGRGETPVEVGQGSLLFGPGPTCTYFIDPETGQRRKAQRGDPGLTARVSDALDNIDYVMSLGLIDDVTSQLAPVYEFAEMIANSSKPILPWGFSPDNVSDIYDIAVAVAGSEEALRQRPSFAFFATSQTPLIQTDDDLANGMWAAERGIPVVFLSGSTAGSSSPVTGAGTLVVVLAGALASLAILQLRVPGASLCIGCVPQGMDLRTCRPAYGSPEMSLYTAALSDICGYLGLPLMGTAGASEAKTMDLQAAIESTFQVVFSGLSRPAMVHDVGFLDCADIGSLEMLVMNDEIIAMTKRALRGIEVNDDTLMLDLIDKVGPGGDFIATMETARRCRTEIWHPSMLDRNSWFTWQAGGALGMMDRVQARLQAILESHSAPALTADVAERIESILVAAEERIG